LFVQQILSCLVTDGFQNQGWQPRSWIFGNRSCDFTQIQKKTASTSGKTQQKRPQILKISATTEKMARSWVMSFVMSFGVMSF